MEKKEKVTLVKEIDETQTKNANWPLPQNVDKPSKINEKKRTRKKENNQQEKKHKRKRIILMGSGCKSLDTNTILSIVSLFLILISRL